MSDLPFIQALRADRQFMAGVRRWLESPPKAAEYAPFPDSLDPRLAAGLRQRGISALYTHQAEVFDRARQGEDVVVVTPTASGKSLAYNLPVMQSILEDPLARALYLFPTKALSQDQQAALNEITLGSAVGIKIATYDGDTPASVRTSARETGQIIISNPDMLHSGVLPNHPKWIKYFRNLKWIVIDEVHTYKGVFGSNVAHVLRRLLRIAAFYGARPAIIACSATIRNPRELVQELCGRDFALVDHNGAPRGRKHFVLYNPPLVDPVQGIRRSTVNESQVLAVKALLAGIKTIVFARSRVRVELIAEYIRSQLAHHYSQNHGIRVESYRGGYLPNERREIEQGLRDGSIQGVVSTNALELGIDIGGLDCAIMAGYPGGISSVWQQSGRAGRSATESLAILVASAAPLDQYLVEHGEYLDSAGSEAAFVNPWNPFIYSEHVKCAAFELPFGPDDALYPGAAPVLEALVEDGVLRHTGGRWYWAAQSYPAEAVSLRSATAENVVIIDRTGGRNEVLGEMDRPSAKELIFPRAVYLHRGRQFMVKELDLEERRCLVEEETLNYYTDAVVKKDLQVLHEDELLAACGVELVLGDVLVRSQVAKFKKIRFKTHENIGFGEIALPEEQMHTRCLVLRFGPGTAAGQALDTLDPAWRAAALIRLGTLVKAVAPAFLLCQSQDFGVAERVRDPHFGVSCLYFHDAVPGGSGMAEAMMANLEPLLLAARQLVRDCPCPEGCPSCVGPRNADEEIGANPKAAVLALLEAWLGLAGGPARVEGAAGAGTGADAGTGGIGSGAGAGTGDSAGGPHA